MLFNKILEFNCETNGKVSFRLLSVFGQGPACAMLVVRSSITVAKKLNFIRRLMMTRDKPETRPFL